MLPLLLLLLLLLLMLCTSPLLPSCSTELPGVLRVPV
jgi:hypothetical protein